MTQLVSQPLRRFDGAVIVMTECPLSIFVKVKGGVTTVAIGGGVTRYGADVLRAMAKQMNVTPAELPRVLGLEK